jgi:uncharacterized protein with PIN domain
MPTIFIRCYAELNEFLLPDRRHVTFPFSLPLHPTVENVANNIGIPTGLIDLVLVNNVPTNLSYEVMENERVAFYPVFENFDISSVTKVRGHPLRQPKFILDVHLGKLAHLLRMLGFDVLYQNNWTKEFFITISLSENRIFLSRSNQVWISESLTHFYLIKNTDLHLQLVEVLEWLDLYSLISPFTRCIECNSLLHQVTKEAILSQIPEKVKDWCHEYQYCSVCSRVYWKGSHYQSMNACVQEILQSHTDAVHSHH